MCVCVCVCACVRVWVGVSVLWYGCGAGGLPLEIHNTAVEMVSTHKNHIEFTVYRRFVIPVLSE